MPTTPLGIWTPSDSDDWDLTVDLAAMANSIDDAIDNKVDPFANAAGIRYATYALMQAATPANGSIAICDNVPGARFVRIGGAWTMFGTPRFASQSAGAAIITSPIPGYELYSTDDGAIYRYSGTAWRVWNKPRTAFNASLSFETGTIGSTTNQGSNYSVASGIYTVNLAYLIAKGSGGGFLRISNLPAVPTAASAGAGRNHTSGAWAFIEARNGWNFAVMTEQGSISIGSGTFSVSATINIVPTW